MATSLELRAMQKEHLLWLLKIKRANKGKTVEGLHDAMEHAVGVMEQEDVAYCEKILGIKAIE